MRLCDLTGSLPSELIEFVWKRVDYVTYRNRWSLPDLRAQGSQRGLWNLLSRPMSHEQYRSRAAFGI